MKLYTTENKSQEKFLRKPTKPVDLNKENPEELKKLIKYMRSEMSRINGIGLSANQVGSDKRLFVANVPDKQNKRRFYAIINPKIVKTSKEKVPMEEGCLSVPHTYGVIERPKEIILEGYKPNGKKIRIKAFGLLAQVFQHEIDHLDGKLFTDKAKSVFKAGEETGDIQKV